MIKRQLALDIAEAVRSVCIDVSDENREVLDEISTVAIVDSLLGDAPPPAGYAIRCVDIDHFSNSIQNPFIAGSWMREASGWRGPSIEQVQGFHQATIFKTKEEAEKLISYCSGYCATFEVVEVYAD